MPRGTTLRNVRVSDDVWERAKAVAEQRGETLSDVMRDALTQYADSIKREGDQRFICKTHGAADTVIDSRGTRCVLAEDDPGWPDERLCVFGLE